VVDAFTMRSWNQSTRMCGLEHRETRFIFPPRGLERVVVRRAKSDRVRACFVVLTNHKAAYWKLLRSNLHGQLALNEPKLACEHSQECTQRGRRPRWEPYEKAELKELWLLSKAL
jgi:hypothetical protein